MISAMLNFKITGAVSGMITVFYSILVVGNSLTCSVLCGLENRVDLGTADVLAIDVLLNCLTVLSSE